MLVGDTLIAFRYPTDYLQFVECCFWIRDFRLLLSGLIDLTMACVASYLKLGARFSSDIHLYIWSHPPRIFMLASHLPDYLQVQFSGGTRLVRNRVFPPVFIMHSAIVIIIQITGETESPLSVMSTGLIFFVYG